MRIHFSIFLFISTFSFGFSQNLISNSGFESNGQLVCSSWYDACQQELTYLCDTLQPGNPCNILFYKDTPPEGGVWSLGATGIGNSFPSTASTYITGQSGTNRYLLNIWMKDRGQAFGGVNIGIRSKGKYELEKTVPADSTDWAFYTVEDTLTLQPADSIQITLSAFAAGPAFGVIYFDQIEFILLDSLSSVQDDDHHQSKLVSVYPNPAIEHIFLDIRDPNQEHNISMYTITGQLFQTLLTFDQSVTIDVKDWGRGPYFYRIERTTDGKCIGLGKFVVE
jgi:hypothetical protein